MRIRVTEEDINTAQRPDGQDAQPVVASMCPIALALKRSTGAMWEVDIVDDVPMAYTKVGGQYRAVDLPTSCRQFIIRWDNHKSVQAFNFNVDLS